MSISHIKKKHIIAFIMKSMPKKLKPACFQDNPVLKLNSASNDRLLRSFYARNSDILAKKLLGKILCRPDLVPNETIRNKVTSNNIILKARIVETEMYPGVQDPASHSFQGKKTKRNGAMFMDPGVCYVYNIYGMYQCLNISSLEPGGCVLLRALEPLQGIEKMKSRRLANKKKVCDKMKEKDLCSGPSKLCQAFDITKTAFNGIDLVTSDAIWLEHAPDISKNKIVHTKRIGIESAGKEVANNFTDFMNCLMKT